MPLTFPSHLAAVLPLALWRPRWFDGVALASGAVAPDVAYLTTGTRFQITGTHTVAGLLWWCLPVALGYAWLVRRCAGLVIPYLPGLGRFRWPAHAISRAGPHRWWITAGSALLGAASHVAWDRATHTDGWLRALGIDWYASTGLHWWTVSDLTSTVVGGVVAVDLMRRLARRARVVDEPAPPVRPAVFRRVAGLTVVAGAALLPFLPAARLTGATGVRLLHVVALAVLLGALAATAEPRRASAGLDWEQR
ncbi:DUF4184 family protein [Micromonospora costi]|uniref:DUF4184 family protein n=1 Tax=Micromonospora costi TaxID=1530042 RepID=A0A3B0A4P7_9ACTN|nr:DUF4184 family protein [Micromonospora costi]RKN55443.1 DUF4184 family protein [Micromonospora costi]